MATITRSSRRTDAEVVYPETDGKPMAENTRQFRWIVIIKEGIEVDFAAEPLTFVAGDLFWYPVEGHPDVRVAPDIMAVVGRPKGDRPSYLQWIEGNIAPQVVFEILSPGNRAAEMREKFEFYEQHGVEEYYIYDPDKGMLEGWLRDGGKLGPIAEMRGHTSPRLGIRFELSAEGPDNLTVIGRSGKPYVTPLELHNQLVAEHRRVQEERRRVQEERRRTRASEKARRIAEELAESEKLRAESEKLRAESESRRAQAAEQLAAVLAAKLRELGIEPD